jgi:hypothetical protein
MIRIKALPGYLAIILLITLYALRSPVYASSPDIAVSSIWLERASAPGVPVTGTDLAPNESFNIVANVTNLGQATASGFYLDVYYDSEYGRGGPDNIAPGEVQQWFVGPLTATLGAHTTQWVVEWNETNNQKQYAFTIGQQIAITTNSITTASSNSTMIVTTTSTVTSGYTTTVTATQAPSSTIQTQTVTQSQPQTTAATVTQSQPPTTITITQTSTQSSINGGQTVTVTQSSPTTIMNSVPVTQLVTQMQTVTQTLLASNPVNAGTGSSTKVSTSTLRSSASTVAKRERNGFYFLEFQDLSQWWTAILLMLSGAWLVLRFPRYRTGGLAIISKLTKVSGRATSKP